VTKAESPAVPSELKTITSFDVFVEPAVYELRSLEAAMKVLTYDGLMLPDSTTITLFPSWRRMIIVQKHIPRTGVVCTVGVRS